jgi:glycine/D-amino acid oxidase-like deaminating enzyme
MNAAKNQDAPFYDVVVIGGALSGAATATLLLRQNSGLRVLTSAAELITAQRRAEPMAQRIERYNRDFALSHRSWFESVYKDKYEYMGEWDLMSLAFRLGLGLALIGRLLFDVDPRFVF